MKHAVKKYFHYYNDCVIYGINWAAIYVVQQKYQKLVSFLEAEKGIIINY